jgi:hypothetical protein
MTVVLGGHLLLAPASIAAGAVATMLGLVLVRLAQQTARARALRTLALVVGHADRWLHKGWLDREALDLKLLSNPHIRPQPSCKLSDHANKWRLSLGARPAGQESGIPMVSPTFILGLEAGRQSAVGRLRLHPVGSDCVHPSAGFPWSSGD